jgi:hypothetical protein
MSRGWELLWAYGLSFLGWCFLGLIFHRLQPPGGLWVFLTSAGATVSAFLLLGDGEPRWPAAIPIVLPCLLLGAALSGLWTTLRLPLLVVAAIPCVLAAGTFAFSAITEESARRGNQTEIRKKNQALVVTIGEDQPLWNWLPLLKDESGVRGETLTALRKLKRRQSDVEAMLADERFGALELIPLLDLEPTPRLQQLLNAACLKDAAYARTMPGGGDTLLEGTFIFTTLPALRWMGDHHGDCRDGITQLKAAALEYSDTKVRAKYIRELDNLLK